MAKHRRRFEEDKDHPVSKPGKERRRQDVEDDERRRRRKQTKKRGGSGMALWFSLIGGVVVLGGVILTVVLLNSGDGADPDKKSGQKTAKKKSGTNTTRRAVSKESQKWKDQFFRLTPGRTLEDVQEAMGNAFRETSQANVEQFFRDRTDYDFAMKEFHANIQRCKVKKWHSWTREGDVYLAGFSLYKDGRWCMTMRGVYLEPEKTSFFIVPLAILPMDLAWNLPRSPVRKAAAFPGRPSLVVRGGEGPSGGWETGVGVSSHRHS